MANSGRVESRIDSGKQHEQIGRDNIRHRFLSSGEELLLCWFPGRRHEAKSVDVEVRLSRGALFRQTIDESDVKLVTSGLQFT